MKGSRLALIVCHCGFRFGVRLQRAAERAGRAGARRPGTALQRRLRRGSRAVLDKYCVTCHNQRMKSGGLALDALDLAQVGEHAETWEKVVRKLRTGAMPPAGRPRPDKATAESVATWLETELDARPLSTRIPGGPRCIG